MREYGIGKKKWQFGLVLGAMLLLTICSGCIFGSKDDGKPHDGYYTSVVMKPNGEFICRGKVSDSDAKAGGVYYKVEMDEKDKDKLKKITAVCGDEPVEVPWADSLHEESSYEFASVEVTEDNGYLNYAFKGKGNKPVEGFYNAASIRFKLGKDGQRECAYLYDLEGNNGVGAYDHIADKNISLAQLLFTYDDDKRLTSIGWADKNGSRVVWGSGIYEIKLSYDDKKPELVAKMEVLGKSGGANSEGYGFAAKTFTYDEKGRITEIRHLALDGKLSDKIEARNLYLDGLEELSVAKIIRQPSDLNWINGHLLEIRAGLPEGGAVTKYTYAKDSFVPETIGFYGKEGQAVGIEEMGGISSFRLTYDDAQNLQELAFFAIDGSAQPLKNGAAIWQFAYDDQGRLSEISACDGEGHLTALKTKDDKDSQIAKLQMTYGDNGRINGMSFVGVDDKPVSFPLYGVYNVYKLEIAYGDKGKRSYKYFDASDKEITVKPEAVLYGTWRYEDESNTTDLKFIFGENNTLSVTVKGMAPVPFKVKSHNLKPDGTGNISLEHGKMPEITEDLYITVRSHDKINVKQFSSIDLVRVQ